MITAASLKSQTSKDLAQLAKKKGVPGWHSMRKDELIQALLKIARKNAAKQAARQRAGATASRNGASTNGARRSSKSASPKSSSKTSTKKAASARASKAKPSPQALRASRKIQKVNLHREQRKMMAGAPGKNGKSDSKDRAILMVRDAYWLQAYWEISRATVTRAQAALAENWHTARPVLRLLEIEDQSSTSASERVIRDIEVHGGVNNWYLDVDGSANFYRVSLGYLADNGKFHVLARSNKVLSPAAGTSDAIDENWTDIAEDCEKVFSMSGGYDDDGDNQDLKELFEERLRRPMGSPVVTQYGFGAEGSLSRQRDFEFEVDAEMIIYGSTSPGSYVTLAGDPVKLRPDGTFTVRLSMPDRRQVLPVVASSSDGVEQRTTVLAIERNTKVMEPLIRETGDS